MARNPRAHWAWWLVAIALLLAWHYWAHDVVPPHMPHVPSSPESSRVPARVEFPTPSSDSEKPLPDARLPAFLPAEARDTIARIQRGGPFLHRQDGNVFGNREGHLPREPQRWYHEYTVETPGISYRGTRRIITGGNPPHVWYYTSDHYDSFRAFDPGTVTGEFR